MALFHWDPANVNALDGGCYHLVTLHREYEYYHILGKMLIKLWGTVPKWPKSPHWGTFTIDQIQFPFVTSNFCLKTVSGITFITLNVTTSRISVICVIFLLWLKHLVEVGDIDNHHYQRQDFFWCRCICGVNHPMLIHFLGCIEGVVPLAHNRGMKWNVLESAVCVKF